MLLIKYEFLITFIRLYDWLQVTLTIAGESDRFKMWNLQEYSDSSITKLGFLVNHSSDPW